MDISQQPSCNDIKQPVIKKELSVLVGAGASVALGLPSTEEITTKIWEIDQDLIQSWRSAPVLKVLRPFIEECYHPVDKNCSPRKTSGPTFEHIVHSLEAAICLEQSEWIQRNFRAIEAYLTPGLRNEIKNQLSQGGKSCIRSTLNLAVSLCYKKIRQLLSASQIHSEALKIYNEFWKILLTEFTLKIGTLNYDPFLETALPGIECGFSPLLQSPRPFVPHRFNNQRQSQLFYLHGSTTFGLHDGKIHKYQDVNMLQNVDHVGSINSFTQSGRAADAGTIISGLDKSAKVLSQEPYLTYMTLFRNSLFSSKNLLIVGYGFQDHHINALLDSFLSYHGSNCKVFCIDFGLPFSHNPSNGASSRFAPEWLLENPFIAKINAASSPSFVHERWRSSGVVEYQRHYPSLCNDSLCITLEGFASSTQQVHAVINFFKDSLEQ